MNHCRILIIPCIKYQQNLKKKYILFCLLAMSSGKKEVSFKEGAPDLKEFETMESESTAPAPSTNEDIIKKHTLDSDEEDAAVDDDVLEDDDIEGQEDDTIAFDGEITIMPFNMKEEMETGHFDTAGTYIFDKEDGIKDSWMDDIDWVKVKQNAKAEADKKDEDDDRSDSSESEAEKVDELAAWKEMVELMKPGESVAKSLRRLGGGNKKMTSAQRLKAKKQGIKPTAEELKNQELFQKLTGLADTLIQTGYMEIYEDTFEKISYKIKEKENLVNKRTALVEEALDMFGDGFDTKMESDDKKPATKDPNEPEAKRAKTEEVSSDVIQWEYKWENKEEAQVHGPYSSEEMQNDVDKEKFPDGVFVRKVGSGLSFYNSKRIDFELYT